MSTPASQISEPSSISLAIMFCLKYTHNFKKRKLLPCRVALNRGNQAGAIFTSCHRAPSAINGLLASYFRIKGTRQL